MQKPRVSAVAALGKNRVIGHNNELLWHLPEDLKRFKALTLGHPIIMGRKTFDSIVASLGRPLPRRTNIVVTRDTNWQHDGAMVAHSIEEALEKARALEQEEIFIIGGAQIYELALLFVDRLYLTLVDDEKAGDAYFPAYENEFVKKISEDERESGGLRYRFVTFER